MVEAMYCASSFSLFVVLIVRGSPLPVSVKQTFGMRVPLQAMRLFAALTMFFVER